MDYTKADRLNTIKTNNLTKELTIDNLINLGIPKDTIAKSTYITCNSKRIRLINADPIYNKVPAIYDKVTPQLIQHLQQFINVGPYHNESVPNSPKRSYRRLDLYLDEPSYLITEEDLNYPLPKIKA